MIRSQDYDCDQAPPITVEPLTCCKISKPFDRKNFPECFIDPVILTTTILPTPPLPTIPVTELSDDDNYPTYINQYGNRNFNRRRGDNEKRRGGYGNNRLNNNDNDYNQYGNRNNENGNRGESSNENERRSGEDDGHHHHHWGHHHHENYHRFGYHGSRHRRQAIFQPSGFRNVSLKKMYKKFQ